MAIKTSFGAGLIEKIIIGVVSSLLMATIAFSYNWIVGINDGADRIRILETKEVADSSDSVKLWSWVTYNNTRFDSVFQRIERLEKKKK